jgi:ABC transporter substrate binding protein
LECRIQSKVSPALAFHESGTRYSQNNLGPLVNCAGKCHAAINYRPHSAVGPCLASYGFDTVEPHRGVASYVDRILKGEKPGNLPVQAPTKYELVINLKTAKALPARPPATAGRRVAFALPQF